MTTGRGVRGASPIRPSSDPPSDQTVPLTGAGAHGPSPRVHAASGRSACACRRDPSASGLTVPRGALHIAGPWVGSRSIVPLRRPCSAAGGGGPARAFVISRTMPRRTASGLECVAQPGAGAAQSRTNRPHDDALGGGRLLVGGAIDAHHLDHPPLVRRQLLDGIADLPQHDPPFLWRCGGDGILHQFGAGHAARAPVSGEVKVLHDRAQPGLQVRARLEASAVAQCAFDAILDKIVGL